MNNTSFTKYNEYLRKTSFLGKFYRKYFLYPKLRKFTSNDFLDVGCGLGDFLSFGSKNSYGIDINPLNIKYCKRRGLKARLIENNKFPFKDKIFKSIIIDQVIEHLNDPNGTILEIKRTLKKGGILIIGLPCEAGFKRDPDHTKFYNYENASILIKKYNFQILKSFYFPLPFLFFGKFLPQQSLYFICQIKD